MKKRVGIGLIVLSIVCWLSVFAVPWLAINNKIFVAGALYTSSYVFWLIAIPFVGLEWMQKGTKYLKGVIKRIRNSSNQSK